MEHHEVIERALRYIEDNLEQPLSLDAVADSSHMSKFYFHRLFSAMMGCSLKQYVLARRLNASLSLIQDGRLSLTDIACRLGFGTPSSFTRAFRRQYGMAPSSLRGADSTLAAAPLPSVVQRAVKHIHGDVVSHFTLTELAPLSVSGLAFEVDLATDDYKFVIRAHARRLLDALPEGEPLTGGCYVIYSNCQPGSTRFKVLCGIPHALELSMPNYFTVQVPPLFCARFQYRGDLLDIGDVFITDYARFLRITRLEREHCPIELIQQFDSPYQLDAAYHIYAPIQKLPLDAETLLT
ncbi:AraC family transcriptional regulator [Paenibacillus sp. PL2-23]|uniref:AraC family transcriptional regulator n=1 Tax=Paenibacillus sp. PL2-23 TaxID=2100729 RepID=UPI0030F98E5D